MSELVMLARELRRLKGLKQETEDRSTELGREIQRVQGALVASLHNQGAEAVKVDGFMFTPKVQVTAKVINEPALMKWLREKGRMEVIKQSVHHKTLASIAQQEMQESGHAPSGVSMEYFETISVRSV